MAIYPPRGTTPWDLALKDYLDSREAQPATTSSAGIVPLATSEQTTAGTDPNRAVTPAGLKTVTDGIANTYDAALQVGPTTWRGVSRTVDIGGVAGFYVRGINLGIGPSTISLPLMWGASWDWVGHTKPNIDRIVALGANTIRVQGALQGYEDAPTQYVARWEQVMDYCDSQGLRMLFSFLSSLDDAGLTEANNARYDSMIDAMVPLYAGKPKFILGWDVGNELGINTSDEYLAADHIRNRIKAHDPLSKTTISIAGVATGQQFFAIGNRDALVDFHDIHVYTEPNVTYGWSPNWFDEIKAETSKPFLIGEFGGNVNNNGTGIGVPTLGSAPAQADYLSAMLKYAGETDCMGFIQWAAQDDNGPYKFGLYDAAGVARPSAAVWQQYPDTRDTGAVATALIRGRTVPVILDNFARANNAGSVGTSPLGGAPVAIAGTWGIDAKGCRVYTDSASLHNMLLWQANSADVEVVAEATINNPNFNVALVFRAVDSQNYWIMQWLQDGSPRVKMYKVVGGVFTLHDDTSYPLTTAGMNTAGVGGASMRIVTRGDQIFIYERTRLIALIVDATHNTATRHGIYTYGSQDGSRARFYKFAVNVPLLNY